MKKINKENERDSFLETIVNFAIVIRTDVEKIEELKKELAQNSCIDIVYQKYSFNKLYIQEDGETDDTKEWEDSEI